MKNKQKRGKSSKPAYLREVRIKFCKRRVKNGIETEKPITSAEQVVEMFRDLMNEAKEKLIVISLDSRQKIICFEVVALGCFASIYLKPFDAIRSAIALSADGVIVVHNHTSGDPEPSQNDRIFTRELKDLTIRGGMKLYDHIVVGDGRYFSFAEEGEV